MNKYNSKILIPAALLAVSDQLTKRIAETNLADGPYYLIEKQIGFVYSKNSGIAFGIPIPSIVSIIVSIILLIIFFYLIKKEFRIKKFVTQLSLAFIIGGGLGNLIDRIANGYVIDFISIWKYPNFNLADIYVTVGILLLLIFYGKIKRA